MNRVALLPFVHAAETVAQWLDGPGAQFARRVSLRSGPKGAKPPYAWFIEVDEPMLGGKPLKLVLPRDFPSRSPELHVASALCLQLPHVESAGRLCLGVAPLPSDYTYPCDAVARTLTALTALLEQWRDPAWVAKELQRERLSYWYRFVLGRHRARGRARAEHVCVSLEVPLTVCQEGKLVAYYRGKGPHEGRRRADLIVSCLGAGDPNVLARRHGLGDGRLERGAALYVPMPENYAWTPTCWPVRFEDLDTLVGQLSGHTVSVLSWLARHRESGASQRHFLVFLVQQGVVYGYQLFAQIVPYITPPTIEPLAVARLDAAWALARDQEPARFTSRQSRRVLLLGCGSLGSPVAEMLARAGIGTLELVDAETFEAENCARHVLGFSALLKSKAKTLAERLRRELPQICVSGRHVLASNWVSERARPGQYDLVVDCTGESSVRIALAQHRGRTLDCPVVHAWLEPYGAAAHTVLLAENDVGSAFDPSGLVNAAEWPDEARVKLPACGAGFHAYGMADVQQAAGFTVERILAILDGTVSGSRVWSWVRARSFFDTLPVPVTVRDWVPAGGGPEDSSMRTREYAQVVAGNG